MKQNTLLYRRVSTGRQETSMETQENSVTRYFLENSARMHGDPNDEVNCLFSDPDTSGFIPFHERRGGSALCQRISYGGIEHVVVANLKRLGRHLWDFGAVWQRFTEAGVQLHLADEGGRAYNMGNKDDFLMLSIKMLLNHVELLGIRESTAQNLKTKFDNMRLTGSVPYGYDVEVMTHGGRGLTIRNNTELRAWLEVQTEAARKLAVKTLVDNPAEQAVIRQMHRWCTVDQWTYKTIATILNNQNVPTKEPAGVAVFRNPKSAIRNPQSRVQVGTTDGVWKIGMVQSILNSKHTGRLLAQTSAVGEQAA